MSKSDVFHLGLTKNDLQGATLAIVPGDPDRVEKIAALMLDEYAPGLAAHGITLHYTQPALADIVAESSTKYGARELRRTIRKTIEDPVSDALVDGRLDGRAVTLELADHDGKAVLDI